MQKNAVPDSLCLALRCLVVRGERSAQADRLLLLGDFVLHDRITGDISLASLFCVFIRAVVKKLPSDDLPGN